MTKDFKKLFLDLDQLFKDLDLTHEPEAHEERLAEMIDKKDIQLICYQWFK
ncbi:MAG: hypothetical protein PUP92_18780 [Rhizonema sp. PD38]|nr:hypothetical protein [Rhizonema sp. PD38]